MLAFLAVTAHAALARGQAPPQGTHVPVVPVVELVVAASADETARLQQVVTELLGRLSVTVRVRRVQAIDVSDVAHPSTSTSASLARAYVDLEHPRNDHAVLWLVDLAHDRVLIRELEAGPGREELTREELGHILEASTEGLLAGEAIGVPRQEALPLLEPAPRREPSPPREPHREAWQGTLLYEAAVLAGFEHLAHGPEAGLFFPFPLGATHLGMWLTGQYRFPNDVNATPIGARLEGGALRALLTFDEHLGANLKLRWGLGGGADFVALEPAERGASRVSLAPSRLLSFGIVRTAVTLQVRLSPVVSLCARIAADFDFSDTTYVFQRAAGDEPVLRPWAVRPARAPGVGLPINPGAAGAGLAAAPSRRARRR
jgi:hypothetical protein